MRRERGGFIDAGTTKRKDCSGNVDGRAENAHGAVAIRICGIIDNFDKSWRSNNLTVPSVNRAASTALFVLCVKESGNIRLTRVQEVVQAL